MLFFHSSSDYDCQTDGYYENKVGLNENVYVDKISGKERIPAKNSKNTTKGLKQYFNNAEKKPFKSREDYDPAGGPGGHVLETIMDEKIKSYYIENIEHQAANNLQEGYDVYMVTMLQLLHGTQKGGVFNIKEYNKSLEDLRKKRDVLLKLLLYTNMKEIDEVILDFCSSAC